MFLRSKSCSSLKDYDKLLIKTIGNTFTIKTSFSRQFNINIQQNIWSTKQADTHQAIAVAVCASIVSVDTILIAQTLSKYYQMRK